MNMTFLDFYQIRLTLKRNCSFYKTGYVPIVGPHPIINGGGSGVGPSKNWVTWGGWDTKNFARKGDNPEKGE